jgi:hypothetical protein
MVLSLSGPEQVNSTSEKHYIHVAAPIPPHLTPDDIKAALHDHNTCLTLQALTTGYKKLDDTKPEIKKDTYWYPVDLNELSGYEVTEVVTIMPWIGEWGKRTISFVTHFQNTPHGIKTRADAPGGVTLRAEFRVIKGDTADAEVEGEGEGIGHADWVLVEDVEVSCAWYTMPLVKGSAEKAHRDICKKVVEKVAMEKRQEALARTAAKGKERAGSGSDGIRSPQAEKLPDKITYR